MPDRELVIVGGGPGGCSAAVYAARSRIDTLLVTEDFGGQLLLTDKVENYLGFPHESGQGLSERYEEHVKDYAEYVDIERASVDRVAKEDGRFVVETGDGTITAEAVIVATGTYARRLDVPGEEEFRNRGISYCSVCDGPLYADEEVAVIGGGYSGTEGALFLSDVADTVYLINYGEELSGEPITLEEIPEQDNIEVIHSADTQEFYGDSALEGLRYEDRETGEEHELEVAGAFIEIGRIPNSDFVEDVETDEEGHIVTDEHQRTSIDGLFAAGDVSDIAEEQAILAAGEGCAAALQAGRYLKGQDIEV
ncbi:MAG: FAD-dependent oxidoreductase [Candidatus Nanohaloarchaea archaeon]|nr:FAD-dependent oxidoreductase [Candidatus Nanohaloarchaea archaeon]